MFQKTISTRKDVLYYYKTTSLHKLGRRNPEAAAGNPLKGLVVHPEFSGFDINATGIEASLEGYHIGLDELMKGDPTIVGVENAFNWTALERRLSASASRNRHVILTIICHYPNWDRLSVPQYLLDAGLVLLDYPDFLGGGKSPDYGDALLLKALRQFILAFGQRYDGDTRIGFIHLGLLGFWGEWHTFPHDFVPETSRISVVKWYAEAFNKTKLQARYPFDPAYKAGFGLIDSSFTYETLNGEANGGVTTNTHYYFWPAVRAAGQTDFWRSAPMGGETRPEQQSIVFEPWYPAGTYMKQDFMCCVRTTHATYIAHQDAFVNGGYKGEKLAIALHAHARMGYNFMITKIALAIPQPGNATDNVETIQIDVTVNQVGVAPFYYPLSLVLDCPDLIHPVERKGVESIIAEGDSKQFSFHGIPATSECLTLISLRMNSSYIYNDRPIKFAQGLNGTVTLNLPTPDSFLLLKSANKVTDIPSASPSLYWSIFPSVTNQDVASKVSTSPTAVPTPFTIASWMAAPPPTPLPDISIPSSGIPTIYDIHAFNTPFTPPILVLEERQRKIKFRNRFIVTVAFLMLVASILITIIRLWRRWVQGKDQCPHERISTSSMPKPPTKNMFGKTLLNQTSELTSGSSECESVPGSMEYTI